MNRKTNLCSAETIIMGKKDLCEQRIAKKAFSTCERAENDKEYFFRYFGMSGLPAIALHVFKSMYLSLYRFDLWS